MLSFEPGPEHGEGTKFRLFPQPSFLTQPSAEPETVRLSPPAGSVGPGPSDNRMYVVDPIGKERPYGVWRGPRGRPFPYLPPWDGPARPRVMPDQFGHFDHLAPGTPEFEMAHLYGTVRFVLDVWEAYLGRPVAWHFARDYRRLELSILRSIDNAFAGYGFLETGAEVSEAGDYHPFALNFDIVAHEVGHLIVYSEIGLPAAETVQGEYFGFHESTADVVALISVLHSDSVVDRLLAGTSGNLYTLNELNRFAELSDNEQIRIAGNDIRLSEFSNGWSDEHDLSQPLTGALFDILIDVFHESLLERGLISPEVEDLADQVQRVPEYEPLIQSLFDQAYAGDPPGFREALLDARDALGFMLAETWRRLSPHRLGYDDVGAVLLGVDLDVTGGRYRRLVSSNLLWREIGVASVGPRLGASGEGSHAFSVRTVTPEDERLVAPLSYHERWRISHR